MPLPGGAKSRQRAWLALAGSVLAGVVVAAWWWATAPSPTPANAGMSRQTAMPAAVSIGALAAAGSGTFEKPSAQALAAILTPNLRLDIETLFMQELGEDSFQNDPAAFKQRLLARLHAQYPPEQAQLMQDLVARYVDYRVALGNLPGAAASGLGDPQALRDSLAARADMRRQFFNDAEYNALFAAQDRLDRYSLERLDILRDERLNASQREAALREAENQFTPQERAQRGQWAQPALATQQTAAYDSQGTSDSQRLAQRSAQFGPAAAQRLAQLDQENRQWQARLQQYANAQAQQKTGQMPADALTALRDQLFTPQEQLRLNAALALLPPPKP